MFTILPEGPEDGPAIEALLDLAFGPGRHARPSYALRRGVAPAVAFARVARADGALIGTLRYWPVRVEDRRALLLGPLAVVPAWRGCGVARALVGESLAAAEAAGERLVLTVGEPDFFARFGFVGARPLGFVMPVPVEERRLLVRALPSGLPRGGPIARADGDLSARAAS